MSITDKEKYGSQTDASGKEVVRWYPNYFAQTWYRTAFLVRRPEQIGKAVDREADWNNIYDSGCNFTCLAMIVGLDPARLASLLSEQRFFLSDNDLLARRLTGALSGLVWDQNAPNHDLKSVTIKEVWHPILRRRVKIVLRFEGSSSTDSYAEGHEWVAAIRARGNHIVCGPEEHSHLVAGSQGKMFFIWDPDDTRKSAETMLDGGFTLRDLFTRYRKQPIEFWEYRARIT